jgi:hypothetical protein
MSHRYRLVIIHSVPDYERWATVVRETHRTDGDVGVMTVCRSIDDPNEVMVNLELDSIEDAKNMIPSRNFRELLDRAGIEIYPPVFIGEVVEDLSSHS